MDDVTQKTVRNPLHSVLVFTGRVGRLPRPLTPLAIALAALALWAVAHPPLAALLWLVAWSAVDWLLLEALPRLGLSYGAVQPTHAALLAVRWAAALIPWTPAAALQPLLWAAAAYALAVEPFRLGLSEVTLENAQAAPGARPLSILQISDLHVERLTRREHALLALVEQLRPDLILLTGDYLNLSYIGEERAVRELRRFLGQLHAPHGIYAVRGTPQVDPLAIMPTLFKGLPITVLEGERRELEVEGHRLRLVGVGCNRDPAADGEALRQAMAGATEGYYTILLYHMPDLLDAAEEVGVDLYLAGHTHGGQLRLPFYGALITGSYQRKRYEMGWYRRARTRLFVSRGIGLEGMGAPRARLLCPPQVLLIRLQGEA